MFKNKANECKERVLNESQCMSGSTKRASICLVDQKIQNETKSGVINKNFIKHNKNQQSHEMGCGTF